MRTKVACASSEEVRLFCESVSDTTTTSLHALKRIERTINWLALIQTRARADYDFADTISQTLKSCERVKEIDPDDVLCDIFRDTESVVNALYEFLIVLRKAEERSGELKADDKEPMVDEYSKSISAVADLHNALVELRWAVMEYDADLSKASGSFTNIDDLMNHLNAA